MIFAAIDIGSNAGRLLISYVFEHNGIVIVDKSSLVRVPLRLGMDVFITNKISDERAENLLKTMKAFKHLIDVYKPIQFRACATAAMREAQNNKEIIELIEKETNIKLEIIDGVEEANIIGTSNNYLINKSYNLTMYIDVGGGSTEITVLKDNQLYESNSFKLGTLRMLKHTFDKNEWDKLKIWLNKFEKDFGKIYCIGSGGNINKILKMYGKRPENVLSYDNMLYSYNHLNSFTLQERIEDMGMRPDRADVIIPAAQIYLSIMKWAKIDKIFVPQIGLSDGIIHVLYKNYKNSPDYNPNAFNYLLDD